MARDYACYSDGWDDESHMADDHFASRPDYREENRRRVDRIIAVSYTHLRAHETD